MRTLLLTLAVTAVLWWLFRPRRSARRMRYAASEELTYRPMRTFRTPGGVATTVYEVTLLGTTWAVWVCDCGGRGHESDGLTFREAQREAIAHHEGHAR